MKIINTLQNNQYDLFIQNMNKDYISIFTPTYNRALFLNRIYDCLVKQTCKKFIWIIVNDGSDDNTDEVVLNILNKEKLPIVYVKKTNGGKHSAFKIALDLTLTNYFMCMDDDDIYSENSVESLLKIWDDCRCNEVGAIRTLVKKSNGELCSNVYFQANNEFVDRTTLEQRYVYNIIQENWTCYKTMYLKSVDLFPSNYWLSEQHTFFSESIWQGRFARKYKCRYVNIVLREYTDDAPVSLMRSKKDRKHYVNMFINSWFLLEEQSDYMDITTELKLLFIVSILRWKLAIPLKDLLHNTKRLYMNLLYGIFWGITWMIPYPKFK